MKKIISLTLAAVMLFSFSTTALAKEESPIDLYVKVFAEINEEYGLQMGLQEVDTSKISLEEFEILVRDVAIQQKELKEYIANREEYISNGGNSFLARSSTKTVKKNCVNNDNFYMKVTYDVNGNQISNPRSIVIGSNVLLTTYTCNNGYPVTQIIDAGRTLTISSYGTWYDVVSKVSFTNIYLYTEFYYDS